MQTQIEIPTQDLPLWMRQARRTVDWGILIVLFFSVVAAWPFILQESVPTTNAAENHAYAVAEYAEALGELRLYPRWSASTLFGYGAPIYNYYPPGLSYVTGGIAAVFMPDDPIIALRLVMVGAVAAAGAMTYVLVLRFSGALAGILAALLYVFSPYLGHTAPYVLGDYPSVLGMALLPLGLWAVNRGIERNHPLDVMMVAVWSAAVVLTIPTQVVAQGGVALVYWLWLVFRTRRLRRGGLIVLAVIAGGVLAAFYWYPAWQEQAAVAWLDSTRPAIAGLLQWPQVILPMEPVDLNALVHPAQVTIGLNGVVFTLAALSVFIWLRQGWDHLLFLLVGLGLLVLGVAVFPAQVWLLGPASFCLAVGGSAVSLWGPALPVEFQRVWLPALVVLVLGVAAPVWLPPHWQADLTETDAIARIQYEQSGYGVAVLPPGWAVPTTLSPFTPPNSDLIDSYRDDRPVRIPNLLLTGQKQASYLDAGTHFDRYLVTARDNVVFDVLRAYDPGWQARLDGEPVRVSVNAATGLTSIGVRPTIDGSLTVTLGPTEARRTGWGITLGGVLLGGIWMLVALRRFQPADRLDDVAYINVPDARLLTLLCIGWLAGIMLFALPGAAQTLYSRPGHGLDGFVEIGAEAPVGLALIGYDRPRQDMAYAVGETIDLTLAWRATRTPATAYRVQLYLERENSGVRWVPTPAQLPADYPTDRWKPGRYVLDTHTIRLVGIAPGTYRVMAELVDPFGRLIRFNDQTTDALPLPVQVTVVDDL
jgi:hypothetical protein